jgi:hypothetical protein
MQASGGVEARFDAEPALGQPFLVGRRNSAAATNADRLEFRVERARWVEYTVNVRMSLPASCAVPAEPPGFFLFCAVWVAYAYLVMMGVQDGQSLSHAGRGPVVTGPVGYVGNEPAACWVDRLERGACQAYFENGAMARPGDRL